MSLRKHLKVFTVFSFLNVQSPDIKLYKWVYPTITCVLLVLIIGAINLSANELFHFNETELIGDINTLTGKLIGFYIAALAAVSSFKSELLDQVMKGETPTRCSKRQGIWKKEKLTRRRFLAILFGYCVALAFLLYISGTLYVHLNITQPDAVWKQEVMHYGGLVALALYLWLISSLLVVTFLGLHYLVERMHRE